MHRCSTRITFNSSSKHIVFARNLLLALVALVLGLAAWSYGRPFFSPSSDAAPAKPIVFDNGSIRDMLPRLAASEGMGGQEAPAGVMRKCVAGEKTVYSNLDCPKGYTQKSVAKDNLSVVPASPLPGKEARTELASRERKPEPHDWLKSRDDEELRQKILERAVERNTR